VIGNILNEVLIRTKNRELLQLAGRKESDMQEKAHASAFGYCGSCAPPQTVPCHELVNDLLRELYPGYNPLASLENEMALTRAISDEVGRGTDPGKLRDRLRHCIAEMQGPFCKAA